MDGWAECRVIKQARSGIQEIKPGLRSQSVRYKMESEGEPGQVAKGSVRELVEAQAKGKGDWYRLSPVAQTLFF